MSLAFIIDWRIVTRQDKTKILSKEPGQSWVGDPSCWPNSSDQWVYDGQRCEWGRRWDPTCSSLCRNAWHEQVHPHLGGRHGLCQGQVDEHLLRTVLGVGCGSRGLAASTTAGHISTPDFLPLDGNSRWILHSILIHILTTIYSRLFLNINSRKILNFDCFKGVEIVLLFCWNEFEI